MVEDSIFTNVLEKIVNTKERIIETVSRRIRPKMITQGNFNTLFSVKSPFWYTL